jgi:hypothetical protein
MRRADPLGMAMDFQALIQEIDNPILRNAGLGVQTGLALTVIRQRCVRHLNDEDSRLWMGIPIVTWRTGNDSQIRLRF